MVLVQTDGADRRQLQQMQTGLLLIGVVGGGHYHGAVAGVAAGGGYWHKNVLLFHWLGLVLWQM